MYTSVLKVVIAFTVSWSALVEPNIVLLVTVRESSVLAPDVSVPVIVRLAPHVVAPNTSRVLFKVVAPVTWSVVPIVA